MRKWIAIGLALFIAALAGATVHFRPDRAIRVATSYVAHNVCSKTFVSGLDPQSVFAEVSDRAGIRQLRPCSASISTAAHGPSTPPRSDYFVAVRRFTTGSAASSSMDRKNLMS